MDLKVGVCMELDAKLDELSSLCTSLSSTSSTLTTSLDAAVLWDRRDAFAMAKEK